MNKEDWKIDPSGQGAMQCTLDPIESSRLIADNCKGSQNKK